MTHETHPSLGWTRLKRRWAAERKGRARRASDAAVVKRPRTVSPSSLRLHDRGRAVRTTLRQRAPRKTASRKRATSGSPRGGNQEPGEGKKGPNRHAAPSVCSQHRGRRSAQMLSARLSARAHVGGTAVSVNRRQRPAAVRAAGAVRVNAAKGDVKKARTRPPIRPAGSLLLHPLTVGPTPSQLCTHEASEQ